MTPIGYALVLMFSCPICGRKAAQAPLPGAVPFCSVRCKQVDLGKWLNGNYRVPTDDAPEDADADQEIDKER